MDEIFFALCKQVDTPVSLGAWLRFKYGEHKQLAELEPPVRYYTEYDFDRFGGDYCVVSFLSKWKGLSTGVDTAAVALSKFKQAEDACRATNDRIRRFRNGHLLDGRVSEVLYLAQRKISRLLGSFSYARIAPYFGWGPGATWDIPRRRAQVDHKLATYPITVSRGNRALAGLVIETDLHWSQTVLGVMPSGPYSLTRDVFQVTETCRAETVPKNAKTDRFIAIEPTMNLFIQKGFGGFLRKRLKTVGINLDDQRVNQTWAEHALSLDLATLDLRAASDTVSKEIVFDLLPVDWAIALDTARSHEMLMPDGSSLKLEKFSSMGNGFTFELESLIFWALTSSVTDLEDSGAPFSVYGDDLICSKRAAGRLVEVLTHCGFTTNGEKSFVEGLFYESCGKHFFNGREATPCYQKDILADLPDVVRCHNRLYRWSRRLGLDPRRGGCAASARVDPRGYRRFRIPENQESDDGFLVSNEEFVFGGHQGFCPSRGWKARVLAGRRVSLPGIDEALLAHYFRFNVSPLVRDVPKSLNGDRGIVVDTQAPTGDWSYGNVDVVVLGEDRKVVFEENTRWIIPQGVCPLSLR